MTSVIPWLLATTSFVSAPPQDEPNQGLTGPFGIGVEATDLELEGSLYQSIDLDFRSPREYDSAATGDWSADEPNPWLHRRLDVYVSHPQLADPIRIPGYFAGDGSGGLVGDVWRAHFTPRFRGDWTVFADFQAGQNLNAAPASVAGVPMSLEEGPHLLRISTVSQDAVGFQRVGFVGWTLDSGYYRFSEPAGGRYVQCGAGSPENFFGYAGFEGAADGSSQSGEICCCRQACFNDCRRTLCEGSPDGAPNFLHRYSPHVNDWQPGDPDWSANGMAKQGRGIIGALNYLGRECRVNSIYVLLMNLGGDGKDTHPFLSNAGGGDCPVEGGAFDPGSTLNYHPARLAQWRVTLEHANDLGIMVQLFLAEQEACNIRWFGPHDSDGAQRNHMSLYRRLFLKQMTAHFGHLLGLRWNLCEENKASIDCATSAASCGVSSAPMSPQFTADELDEMARWIQVWDQFPHPIGVHTPPNTVRIYEELLELPVFPKWMTATSLQIHGEGNGGDTYELVVGVTRNFFASFGFGIPVFNDEQGSAAAGLSAETNADALRRSSSDDRRKRILYDVLLSGGQVSYYFGSYAEEAGGGDLRTENFRERGSALKQLGYAGRLMQAIEIWRHSDADQLMVGDLPGSLYGDPEVSIRDDGRVIAVYYSGFHTLGSGAASGGQIDLSGQPDRAYTAAWFNPKTQQRLATEATVIGGDVRSLPLPAEFAAGELDRDDDLLMLLYDL